MPKVRKKALFVLVLSPVLLFFKQIIYIGDVVAERLKSKLTECSTSEIQAQEDEIIFNFKCSSLAYLEDFIIPQGSNAVLNLFGPGVINIKVSKIKNNPKTMRSLVSSFSVNVGALTPKKFSDKGGFSQHASDKVILNTSSYEPGWYEVLTRDSSGKQFSLVLFIESLERNRVLFVESTDTLVAYNQTWKNTKIPNNYKRYNSQLLSPVGNFSKSVPIEYKVSPSLIFPIRCDENLIAADLVLKHALQKNGIEFTEVSDELLDHQATFKNVDTIIFGAHNEYWTLEKLENLSDFVERGGKLLFLGGNQAYREISREDDYWKIRMDSFDKDKDLYDKIVNLMGTFFKGDIENGALRLTDSRSWKTLFGIAATDSFLFGKGSEYSYCMAPFKLAPINFMSGASSIETDQMADSSNEFIVLAKGTQESGGADVVYKMFEGSGELLNFSSVGLWHSVSDPLILELIKKFL